jgi:hypothetical protein
MGVSAGSEKTKTQQQTAGTQTNTLSPEFQAAVMGNYNNAQAIPTYKGYEGEMVAGFNPDQQAAQDRARALSGANVGGGLLDEATAGARTASSYQPQTITAGGYNATRADAAQLNRGDVRDVSYKDIGQEDISRFMNPYLKDVVDLNQQDIDRRMQRAQLENQEFATKAGILGSGKIGTGLFGLRDNTQEIYAREGAMSSANLRNAGFNTALGAAQNDAGRKLQTESFNSGQDFNVGALNTNNRQQANLDFANRNDAAQRFGLDQSFNAQTANAGLARDAAGLSFQGSQALTGIADQQRRGAFQDLSLLGGVGDAQQANYQARLDAEAQERDRQYKSQFDRQQIINQSLGLVPQTGTVSTQGTQKGNTSGTSIGASASYGGK